MHRETPVYTELSPQGWTSIKNASVCSECDCAIPAGEPAWHVGGYACCQFCFGQETPALHPIIVGTLGPKAGWVWRPSKSQAALGWSHDRCQRDDGTMLEWMDRLDIGSLN